MSALIDLQNEHLKPTNVGYLGIRWSKLLYFCNHEVASVAIFLCQLVLVFSNLNHVAYSLILLPDFFSSWVLSLDVGI